MGLHGWLGGGGGRKFSKTQERQTRTHIHALSGFRTHDPSVVAAKSYDLGHAAAVIG
jgi:hypothetical protein